MTHDEAIARVNAIETNDDIGDGFAMVVGVLWGEIDMNEETEEKIIRAFVFGASTERLANVVRDVIKSRGLKVEGV